MAEEPFLRLGVVKLVDSKEKGMEPLSINFDILIFNHCFILYAE